MQSTITAFRSNRKTVVFQCASLTWKMMFVFMVALWCSIYVRHWLRKECENSINFIFLYCKSNWSVRIIPFQRFHSIYYCYLFERSKMKRNFFLLLNDLMHFTRSGHKLLSSKMCECIDACNTKNGKAFIIFFF